MLPVFLIRNERKQNSDSKARIPSGGITLRHHDAQKKVRRAVDDKEHEGEDDENVDGRGAPLAMEEGIGEGVVHVHGGRGEEARRDERGQRHGALHGQRAAAIAKAIDVPKQQKRHGDVKQREQAHPERKVRVEHIFGAAQQRPVKQKLPGNIGDPGGVHKQRSHGLAGDKQRAARDEADAAENHRNVAKMQKIHGAIRSPVGGNPDGQPDDGANTQRHRKFAGRKAAGGVARQKRGPRKRLHGRAEFRGRVGHGSQYI